MGSPVRGESWRFTADALPMTEPATTTWERRYGPKIRMEIAPIGDGPVQFDLRVRALPGLGILSGFSSGVRHRRMSEHLADRNDDLTFLLNMTGRSVHALRGRQVVLGPGEAVLKTLAEPRTTTRPEPTRYHIVRVPRATLAPLVPHIDDAILRRIPHGTGALRLLTQYVRALTADPVLAAPDVRRLITAQLCDLIAVTIGATREAAEIAEGRGIRAARLRAIKSDIEAHIASGDVSPAAVARRQMISESYIRKLLEAEGTSFSAFVLERRLARAHRMLTDSRWIDWRIASIAFQVGFGDLSYFNRTFRRAYGATPSELREAIRRRNA